MLWMGAAVHPKYTDDAITESDPEPAWDGLSWWGREGTWQVYQLLS